MKRVCTFWSRGLGLGRDGGMAEFMLVPDARLLVPLGELDPVAAAPLTDAGLTPYHSIKQALPVLTADATTLVIGVGGLGHLAVQILRAITAARIVALDVRDDKLAQARELGADEIFRSDLDAAQTVREMTRGVGADAVFDFVGVDATLQLALGAVRSGGHVAVVRSRRARSAAVSPPPSGYLMIPASLTTPITCQCASPDRIQRTGHDLPVSAGPCS